MPEHSLSVTDPTHCINKEMLSPRNNDVDISVKKFLAVLMDSLTLTQVNILQRNIYGDFTQICLTISYVDYCNHVHQVSCLFQIRVLGHNFIALVHLDIL
jgi:hypothetical protein